ASVRTMGTILPDGSAGPLAIAASYEVERDLRGSAVERTDEVHLAAISWTGEILLERALLATSFHETGGGGRDLRLTPLVFTGDALVVWSQARTWSRRADRCVGSL